MLQKLAKVAHGRVRRLVDTDHRNLLGDVLAADRVAKHRRNMHRRRHARNVLPGNFTNLRHTAIGIRKAVEGLAFEHDVGKDTVNPVLHLMRETLHHGVHDNHRRHAKHDADDGR
jgi:hypothetical protein